jgi:pilus assembly protein CpaB
MDKRKVILLVAALLIAAVTAFMAKSMFTGAAAPQAAAAPAPVPTGPEVLVATRALPVGTIITADAIRYQPWPAEMIESAYFLKDEQKPAPPPADPAAPPAPAPAAPPAEGAAPPAASTTPIKMTADQLIGTVVRTPITAGQPISQGAIVAPGDRGFLAAALGPGMRAVSVPVSELTGVAGFIFPGDRVDLVLTQGIKQTLENTVSGMTIDRRDLKVSETIIRNLRVLATDQRASPSVDEKGNTIVSNYKLVTLEVTPRLAEKISVAQAIGTISLSLRALSDNAEAVESALASGSIKIPKGASAEEEERILKSVAQRPSSGATTYATGGDVSRFQPSKFQQRNVVQEAIQAARMQQAVEKAIRPAVVQKAVEDGITQKEVAKAVKGPVVRVSRGGGEPDEVEVRR